MKTHYRPILLILALIALLTWALALGAAPPRQLTEDVWTVELVGDCYLDYHSNIQAVALACSGVDYLKLWPLPVEQPWQEAPDPLPPLPGAGYAWLIGPSLLPTPSPSEPGGAKQGNDPWR